MNPNILIAIVVFVLLAYGTNLILESFWPHMRLRMDKPPWFALHMGGYQLAYTYAPPRSSGVCPHEDDPHSTSGSTGPLSTLSKLLGFEFPQGIWTNPRRLQAGAWNIRCTEGIRG
ncbi:MAG: hypothetical protein WCV84_03545 [Patescibacteria group bacterium]